MHWASDQTSGHSSAFYLQCSMRCTDDIMFAPSSRGRIVISLEGFIFFGIRGIPIHELSKSSAFVKEMHEYRACSACVNTSRLTRPETHGSAAGYFCHSCTRGKQKRDGLHVTSRMH